jgi:hypothetical protein
MVRTRYEYASFERIAVTCSGEIPAPDRGLVPESRLGTESSSGVDVDLMSHQRPVELIRPAVIAVYLIGFGRERGVSDRRFVE